LTTICNASKTGIAGVWSLFYRATREKFTAPFPCMSQWNGVVLNGAAVDAPRQLGQGECISLAKFFSPVDICQD
jgi:hypothetical protein